jgi:CubicO group peptidase (beta-lactamase class C family)
MARLRVEESMIHGEVAPGFEAVREAFTRNFTHRGELGAACCVYKDGEKVVDLWGGYRDEKKRLPWEEDTLVLVFSTTKGMAAMTIAVAHSRGWLDFDEKVATYWPEFAQAGKEDITVRQLLSHQAGLSAIDEPLTPEVLADLDKLAKALAKQAPSCEPGARQGYHGISLGFYEGELIRRVDPQKRSLGKFFAQEIARPMGIEFYIGTPADIPEERIAVIKDLVIALMIFHLGDMPGRFSLAMLNPRSLSSRSFMNPKLKNPSDLGVPPLRYVEMPAANGIGQVRGIARAYNAFAMGGGELGIGEETMKELTQPAVKPSGGCFDQVLKLDTNFSLGYIKPFPDFEFGSSVRSFGTMGAGGSFGYADPDAGIGYAYAMNRMGYCIFDDPRDKAIRDALYGCL